MTEQKSFKRRVRARMAKTGERYAAARRVLVDQRVSADGRAWVAQPDLSDETLREATGRGWDEWCDVIDAWSGHGVGHTAIVAHLQAEHGVDSWWSQSLTVGYERITGLRLPHQMADGTFTANKSRTIDADEGEMRRLLLDDDHRRDLFGGIETTRTSRTASRSIRLTMVSGTALISLESKADGRTKVTIAHSRLPTFDEVEEWKFYWSEWLDALHDAST